MQIDNYNLILLTETKIMDKAYLHNYLGYNAVCYQEVGTAAGGVQGGVGLVLRERPDGWSVELTRFHRPIVASCEIMSVG